MPGGDVPDNRLNRRSDSVLRVARRKADRAGLREIKGREEISMPLRKMSGRRRMTNDRFPKGNDASDKGKGLSLGGVAYQTIKQAIVECELRPGEELSQSDVIARYDLTNAQARYALVRLTQEGWVRPLAQRGYLVAPLTIQDVEDVFDMRMLLEPVAMRRAAGKIDRATLKFLKKIGTAEYVSGDPVSIRKFLQKNRQFYMTIVHCAGNRQLAKMIDQLFDSSNRLLYFHMIYSYEANVVRRGHEKLVEALEKGDGKEAERLRRIGLEHGRQVIQKALLSMPSVMDINLVA